MERRLAAASAPGGAANPGGVGQAALLQMSTMKTLKKSYALRAPALAHPDTMPSGTAANWRHLYHYKVSGTCVGHRPLGCFLDILMCFLEASWASLGASSGPCCGSWRRLGVSSGLAGGLS
eukprot:3247534-Pyramimonas_sp.AAC.1